MTWMYNKREKNVWCRCACAAAVLVLYLCRIVWMGVDQISMHPFQPKAWAITVRESSLPPQALFFSFLFFGSPPSTNKPAPFASSTPHNTKKAALQDAYKILLYFSFYFPFQMIICPHLLPPPFPYSYYYPLLLHCHPTKVAVSCARIE